jgi:hypothetical protein
VRTLKASQEGVTPRLVLVAHQGLTLNDRPLGLRLGDMGSSSNRPGADMNLDQTSGRKNLQSRCMFELVDPSCNRLENNKDPRCRSSPSNMNPERRCMLQKTTTE